MLLIPILIWLMTVLLKNIYVIKDEHNHKNIYGNVKCQTLVVDYNNVLMQHSTKLFYRLFLLLTKVLLKNKKHQESRMQFSD